MIFIHFKGVAFFLNCTTSPSLGTIQTHEILCAPSMFRDARCTVPVYSSFLNICSLFCSFFFISSKTVNNVTQENVQLITLFYCSTCAVGFLFYTIFRPLQDSSEFIVHKNYTVIVIYNVATTCPILTKVHMPSERLIKSSQNVQHKLFSFLTISSPPFKYFQDLY